MLWRGADMIFRFRNVWLIFLAIFLVCPLPSVAAAQDPPPTEIYWGHDDYRLPSRQALIIGVSGLQENSGFLSLKNPRNDAKVVTEALGHAGFDPAINLAEQYAPEQMTRQNIKKALYDFALMLKASQGVGLIYFSGHGVERNGKMYVAPYDAYVHYERDLDEELIPVSLFYDAFQFAGNPLNLLVLDACRDNPWTKPLDQFGPPRSPPVAQATQKNVIVFTSTLSGSKALDGDGNMSPYADSFASALKLFDQGLAPFFDEIARRIRFLNQSDPTIQVPSYTPTGREFVFDPTIATFNREFELFKKDVALGNRFLLNDLLWTFGAGYFYKATQKHLATADLVPATAAPTRIVQVVGASNLRVAPTTSSDIADVRSTGARLAVVQEGLQDRQGQRWLAVQPAASAAPVFIRTDRVQAVAAKPPAATLAVSFVDDAGGGLPALALQSATDIKNLIAQQNKDLITRIELIGYRLKGTGPTPVDPLKLLGRQTVAVQALSDAGIEAPKVQVSTKDVDDASKDGAVELVINGN